MSCRPLPVALLASCLAFATACAARPACKEPGDAPIFSPPLANVVTGKGRLPFYSAPDEHCPMEGVFIVPNDDVVAYAETDGWTSVMYMNPKSGAVVMGWVRSNRLKVTGTAGPSQ